MNADRASTHPGKLARRVAGRADWEPLGGAFAASAALHVLAFAGFAAILARAPAAALPNLAASPIQAVLVDASPATPRPEPVRTAVAPSPAPPVRQAPALPPAAPLPWAALPRSVDPPPSLFDAPMLSEGVAFFETRNLAMLGEGVERKIIADFPDEAPYPVTLNPPEAMGYPLAALGAGIEGRVLVWFGVDEEGKVVDREALDGPPELVAWVLPRLERLVDKPAHDELKPRRGWVALEIAFSREAAEDARTMREAALERLRRSEELAKSRAAGK